MIKKKSATNKKGNVVDIHSMLLEYDQLRERQKAVKKRLDDLAKYIKKYVTDNGVKDQNGSYYSEDADFIYGSQARKSVKLNDEKAREFFKNKKLYDQVIDIKEVLNEDKIEQLVIDEKITIEDIESISETKTTYAIDIKLKETKEGNTEEEMPMVEVKKLPKKKG